MEYLIFGLLRAACVARHLPDISMEIMAELYTLT
jgi:hypothetical protein